MLQRGSRPLGADFVAEVGDPTGQVDWPQRPWLLCAQWAAAATRWY